MTDRTEYAKNLLSGKRAELRRWRQARASKVASLERDLASAKAELLGVEDQIWSIDALIGAEPESQAPKPASHPIAGRRGCWSDNDCSGSQD